MSDLKPCPFCGPKLGIVEVDSEDFGGTGCVNCGVFTRETYEWNDAECWKEIDRLEKEKRELIEALRQAQLGLSQAAMERQAPCFAWPLQEVETVLAKHKQSETKGDEREST